MDNSSFSNGGQIKSNPIPNDAIWNRVGHVEVLVWQGDKAITYNFDGLDFKFSVTQILGRMPEGNMSVSICGLSQNTANQLVTLCSTHEALMKRKTLKLYAGYSDPENKDYKGELLATMDIINATIISPPPDIWLEITAVYAGWLNDLKIAFDMRDLGHLRHMLTIKDSNVTETEDEIRRNVELQEGLTPTKALYVDIGDVMYRICLELTNLNKKRGSDVKYESDYSVIEDFFGAGDNVKINTPGRTRHFFFSGTLSELTTKISETYRVNVIWEDREDKKIYLVAYPDPRYTKGLSNEQKRRFTRGATIKYLDVNHGLIGIPKLKDAIKLECRCFLDGKIKAGDFVSVKSEMLPVIYEYGEPVKPKNKSLAQQWDGGSFVRDKKGKFKPIEEGSVKAYQIMRIKYTGHLRGNQWYCDIEARCPLDVSNLTPEKQPRTVLLTEDFSKKLTDWDVDETTGDMTYKRTDEAKKYKKILEKKRIEKELRDKGVPI